MPELTIEALQHFMIENGCKVKSTDAIEFFRNNFINSVSDVGKNKDLFKQYMEELTTAQLAENGDRYLVLKRKHMVYSPYNSSARIGDRSTTIGHKAHIVSPRVKRSHSEHRPISPRTHTSPKVSELPQSLPNVMNSKSRDIPASLLDVAIIPYGQIETDGGCTLQEDGGFETDESGDDLSDMELGSVGGCSHNQLEPNQKEWIYKTAIGDLDSVTRLLLQDTEKSLVKYKDFISGYTGLHWACKLSRVDMVHVLLTAGSDVNSKAFNGMTPLHLAAQGGSDVIIDILLDNNADRFTRDYNGKYPVYYMSGKCSPKTRELLTPPVVSQQKPRRSCRGTPISRRPSLSSLDDVKRDAESSKTTPKQYMSDGLKLIRSSFRSKRESPLGNHFRPGSPNTDNSQSNTPSPIFVRPRPLTKSATLPPMPPFSRLHKNLRASIRAKLKKSNSVHG